MHTKGEREGQAPNKNKEGRKEAKKNVVRDKTGKIMWANQENN